MMHISRLIRLRPTTGPRCRDFCSTGISVALFAAVFAVVPVGPARAVVPGTNGSIAFTSNRDGNQEIYTMNADGSGQIRFTENEASDRQPVWSPEGTRIAFTSDRDGNDEIYVMKANGTGLVRLTNNAANDSDPAWSPDGSQIAFTSGRDGNDEIYTMNADGAFQGRITYNLAIDGQPAWSPDGTRIAFTSDRDGNREVYVMSVSGLDQTRLIDNVASDRQPAWSPDGTRIAFITDRDGNDEIYAMNADGSVQGRLTDDGASESRPAWSPDGTRMAFATDRDGNVEVYVMSASGSDPTNIANTPMVDSDPDWQRAPPPNDDKNQAQAVGQGQYTGILAGATPDGTTSCPGTGQPDIWYLFTAPVAGKLRADTCGSHDLGGVDSGADTILSLHAADGLTEIACNDDWPAGVPACPAASGALYDSYLRVPVAEGQQILIRVSKYTGSPPKNIILNVAFDADSEPDSDQDGIIDGSDNCLLVANPSQLDADHDGYGNICDGDLNNSGLTTAQDNTLLRSELNQLASANPIAAAADLNGSGQVTAQDSTLLRNRLNSAPGPSGLTCAGTIPCP